MEVLARTSIAVALACTLAAAVDQVNRPQPMAIVNVVWPVTCLYFGVFGL